MRFTARRGAAFRFKLSERAAVKIAIRRRAAHGSRFVKVGTLVRAQAAGAGRITIKRRVAGAALRPGSYTATVTATDAAGNRSRAYVLKFRVVRA